jgi:hypothetical protein
MIKLSLIHDFFSPSDGELNVDRLIHDHLDDVVLSCNEPRYRVGGDLERASAAYLSKFLPCDYVAKWDESTEGYHKQQNYTRDLPAIIDELRFKVLLQKVE